MVRNNLRSALLAALVLTAVSLAPAAANAQAPPPSAQTASGNAATLLFPRLMVSFGVGRSADYEARGRLPLQTASVQYLWGRHFIVEGEIAHWANTWNDRYPGYATRGPQGQVGFSGDRLDFGRRRAWSAGGNLLYRSEPRRVSWFVGGGPFLERRSTIWTLATEGCVAPGFESSCWQGYHSDYELTRPAFQGLTGADVQIAGPLRAYADLRFTTADHAFLQMSTGVRVVALTKRADTDAARRARRIRDARTAPAAPATTPATGEAAMASTTAAAASGKDVRISLVSGDRPHGRFVSLTATELTVHQGNRDVRYPLDQVLLVETVQHTARKAAIGSAIVGFVAGYLGSCGGGDEEDCWPEVGALFAGIGAGAGGIIGAMVDRSNAPKHVLYAAPTRSPSVHLAPIVTPKKAGVAVAVRW